MEPYSVSAIDCFSLEDKRDVFPTPKQGNNTGLCRLCLNSTKLHIIEHLRFTNMHDNLKFLEDELQFSLPLEVCKTCLEKLAEILLFIKRCKDSYQLYTKMYGETVVKQERVDIKEEPFEMEDIGFNVSTDDPLDVLGSKEDEKQDKTINLDMEDKKTEDQFVKIEIPEAVDETFYGTQSHIASINVSDSEGGSSDIEEVSTSTVPSLPEKSKPKYEQTYDRFIQWCNQKSLENETSEKVLLAYFEKLSKTYKSSTLWSYYSMLRATISLKKNVDISKHNQLTAFLKSKAEGYKPRKSKVFFRDDIVRFLKGADDEHYLMAKVALIIGIAGACRKEEFANLLLENVKDEGYVFRIQIPHRKREGSREFFVKPGRIEGCNMVEIIRKYVQLRPALTDHGRFFVGYRKGFCIKQPVGINTFGGLPRRIALFLKLPNPEEYTGHCFRRSAASLLMENERLKRQGNRF